MSHSYHFPTLWTGKAHDAVVTERHDIALLFDATNCNPNGDPDTGNMPRLQPDTLRGLVTDVCLKRKVRNFFSRHTTAGEQRGENDPPESSYHLFIREGAVIQRQVESPDLKAEAQRIFKTYTVDGRALTDADWEKIGKKAKKAKGDSNQSEEEGNPKKTERDLSEYQDRAYRDALCSTYFDVRYFGQVVSTEGPLKGSFYGQIRGPLQITFAESLDKILQLDFSITRCAVANEKEAEKKDDDNRTMGRKHAVPYGLYRCHIHFSPGFAAKTHFTYGDLDNFLFALTRCLGDYNVDGSSARPGGMRVVGLVDFQHTSALGNAPAHKVFDLVKVEGVKFTAKEAAAKGDQSLEGKFKSSGSEFPGGLHDYTGSAPDGPLYAHTNNYGVVTGCSEAGPSPKDGNVIPSTVTARRLIWEISGSN